MADLTQIELPNGVTYDIKDNSKLIKTTYEYNTEIAFGSTGKLLVGKFQCYDSNVTITIQSTTNITYYAVAILATQNIDTAGGGTFTWNTYGDTSNTVTPNLYAKYTSGSNWIEIYFSPSSWSKNLIHIQANALKSEPTNICESVSEIPSSATRKPTNTFGTSPKFTDTTYTFANGTNGFTVTPSGGSAQTVTVTPSITNNVTGSGTSGYIAKFNGANTITNGPAIGSGTTKYLREDGTWQTPPSSSDTTYTIGTSGNNITLTPSSGSVQSITAPYATSAGSAASATSATSATTASKLGSSNVGSATNPVYLNGGTATACTYSLNKTVPSDAVFTDTTYSSLPAASGGTSLSLVTTGEKYTWNNKALGDLSNVVVTNPDGGDILQYSYAEGNWVNGKITDMWVDGIYPVGAVFHVDTRTIPTGSHITLSQLNYSNLLGAPSNLPGESGGTDVSLVTTGEKYTWNNGCTDTKVTQTSSDTADSGNYPILFSNTADNITRTGGARKSSFFTVNPANRSLDLFNEDTGDDIVLDGTAGSITVTGEVSCSSMNVEDISEDYIPSKTSGNWSIGSDDGVYRIKAYRMGNLVQMTIAFHGNGSAVSSGSNGFIGAITGGALPVSQITLNGFYSSSILAATLDTDGSITVRPFSASCTLSSASRAYLTGIFICE